MTLPGNSTRGFAIGPGKNGIQQTFLFRSVCVAHPGGRRRVGLMQDSTTYTNPSVMLVVT